ncbi:MAG: helix-turn-helix domain-containing protein [Candidatus Woesebacteria bacterium]
MIEQLFSQLGLSSVDATVYEQLLKLKMATPATLARTTKVSRENVYYVLKKLSDHGLVVQIPGQKKLTYQVEKPDHLVRLHAKKEKEFEESKTSLQEIVHAIERQQLGKDFKPAVRYYEDISGVKQAYFDFLDGVKKGEILGVVNYDWPKELEQFFVVERLKSKVGLKLLVVKTERSLRFRATDPKEIRGTRVMSSSDFPAGTYMAVLDKRVLIVNRPPGTDVFGIGVVIEHQAIANAFRAMFWLIWATSTELLA